MNKRLFPFIIFVLALMLVVPVCAQSEVWLSGKIKNAELGDKVEYSKAPKLVFDADSSADAEVEVTVELLGGKWLYDGEGTLTRGVDYKLLSESKMQLTIDSSSSGFTYKDIELPLYMQITGEGYIKYIVTDEEENVASTEDVITTVKCDKNKLSAFSSTKNIRFNGTVAFSIEDETKQSFPAGTAFNVSLNNDFYFISAKDANGSGKFENACEFKISTSDPSKASIVITKNTPCEKGKIAVSGINIQKKDKNVYDTVMLSVKLNDDDVYTDMSWSTAVAKYNSSVEDVDFGIEFETKHPSQMEETTDEITEATTEGTAQTTQKTDGVVTDVTADFDFGLPVIPDKPAVSILKIPIGSPYYTLDGKAYSIDAPAYISKDNYTMLPVRAVANALGVQNESISYDAKTFTATLKTSDKTLVITKGKKEITVNGQTVAIPTSADIQKSRLFVPVRAIANAFGIDDSKISYDDKNKVVTINLY